MARQQLFDFMHNGKRVNVFTGESSADVYYSINGGGSTSTGMRYSDSRGNFTSGSGGILSFEEAKSRIRNQL